MNQPQPQAPQQRAATIDAAEQATILAALTFWRQCRLANAENRPPTIHQIATNGGTVPNVADEAIKGLISRLNGADVIYVRPAVSALGTRCSVCGEPQYSTPGGACCPNAHGGALPLMPGQAPLWAGPATRDPRITS